MVTEPDPHRAARAVVARGYDAIANTYACWGRRADDPTKRRFAELAIESRPPEGGRCLDLGCGTGEHVTRLLAEHFEVTAVDISPASIKLARTRVPGPTYVVADMTSYDPGSTRFDVVAAFFSIIHVPRDDHADLFRRIASWLRPGGIVVATMGAAAAETHADDWLGAPMYWSHHDAVTNRRLVEAAGLAIELDELVTDDEDGVVFTHQWLVARR